MKWYKFDPTKGFRQKRPKVNQLVLCALEPIHADVGFTHSPIVVGRFKNAAGDKSCPMFITPSCTGLGKVIAWCDGVKGGFVWYVFEE